MKKRALIIMISLILIVWGVYQFNTEPDKSSRVATVTNSQQQIIELGEQVFEKNCLVCHGKAAQGIVKEWRKPLANGKYPPPPLNGSAHAWHHPLAILLQTINNGSIALGGQMPAFGDKLTEQEKMAVLHYLYSLWPATIQQMWTERFGSFGKT